MKMYVWEGAGVLSDHTHGMICVLASSLDDALKLIEEKNSSAMNNFPVNNYRIIDSPEAFICWGGGIISQERNGRADR